MSDKKPRLTRDEQRSRLRTKARDLDRRAAHNAIGEDETMDAMVKKSIKDHGA